MSDFSFKGLGVALVTPFKENKSIDFNSLEKIIDHVIAGGCDYIVALGTTGETPSLSFEERKEVADFVSHHVGNRTPLIIGIGGNCTDRVVKDLESYDLTGYCGVLSVTPYYNKPSQAGLYEHFKIISEASPLPLMLYNVPSRTGVNLSSNTTLKLSETSEKIRAIKEASGNLAQCKEIIDHKPEHFNVISGNDGDTLAMIKMGAQGVVSVMANAFPKEMKKLVNHCLNKEFSEAEIYNETLKDFYTYIFEDGNPSGIKYVLSILNLLDNNLRLPLVPVNRNLEQKLREEIKKLETSKG